MLNMFVGVLVDNFHDTSTRLKEEIRQRKAKSKIKDPKGNAKGGEPDVTTYVPFRKQIYAIVTHSLFQYFIYAMIIINVLFMATEHYGMSGVHLEILSYVNYFFTAVFVIEAIVKLYALGKYYFHDNFNKLDFVIVCSSVTSFVLNVITYFFPFQHQRNLSRLLKTVQVFRVLRLVRVTDGLKSVTITLLTALPQIGNLGLLLGLQFFIYAALGVELFGKIECSFEHLCEGLGEHANFHHFGMAFLTLFRITTGDNWNGILKDTLNKNCDSAADCEVNCCASSALTVIYFITFVLTTQLILLNIVVAMLMKGFDDANNDDNDECP